MVQPTSVAAILLVVLLVVLLVACLVMSLRGRRVCGGSGSALLVSGDSGWASVRTRLRSGAEGADDHVYYVNSSDGESGALQIVRFHGETPGSYTTMTGTSGTVLGNVCLAYSSSASKLALMATGGTKDGITVYTISGSALTEVQTWGWGSVVQGATVVDEFVVALNGVSNNRELFAAYLGAASNASNNSDNKTMIGSSVSLCRIGCLNSNVWYCGYINTGTVGFIGYKTIFSGDVTIDSISGSEVTYADVTEDMHAAANVGDYVLVGTSNASVSQACRFLAIDSKSAGSPYTITTTGTWLGMSVGDEVRMTTGWWDGTAIPSTTAASLSGQISFSTSSSRNAALAVTSSYIYTTDNTTGSNNVYRIAFTDGDTPTATATAFAQYDNAANGPVGAIEGDTADVAFVASRRVQTQVQYADDAKTATSMTATGPTPSGSLYSYYSMGTPTTTAGGEGDPEITTLRGETYLLPHDDKTYLVLKVGADELRITAKMVLEDNKSYHHSVRAFLHDTELVRWLYEDRVGPPTLDTSIVAPGSYTTDAQGFHTFTFETRTCGRVTLKSSARRGLRIKVQHPNYSAMDGYVVRQAPEEHVLRTDT